MADRRMFSKRIISSARFLRMPVSTRCLYYDLGMNADDDGVVEAYNVLSLTGATEDDLRVLAAKGFVQVLNEDLVTYICDWTENNRIRADRKIDSIYKPLLLQMLPDVHLLESKERADRPKNEVGTSHGQPMDGIGKGRIGKGSIGKGSIDYNGIKDAYNNTCPSLPTVRNLSNDRKKAIKARLNTYSLEKILEAFKKAEASDFLTGKNDSNWTANFDWIMSDKNMAKILDGNYDNKKGEKGNARDKGINTESAPERRMGTYL